MSVHNTVHECYQSKMKSDSDSNTSNYSNRTRSLLRAGIFFDQSIHRIFEIPFRCLFINIKLQE